MYTVHKKHMNIFPVGDNWCSSLSMVIASKRSLLSIEKSRALARQQVSNWEGRGRHFDVMVDNPVMR